MSDSPWKLLSVQDFLSRYSEAQVDSSAQTDSVTLDSHIVWQKRTVQDFFASCQWTLVENQPQTSEPFSLGLSVQSYFQHFQWHTPIKSLVSAAPEPPIEQPSFDVQKFSDLF